MKKLLIEEARDAKRLRLPSPISRDLNDYQVFTLDRDAVELAGKLSASTPHETNQMRLASHPPYRHTWIEMNAREYLEARGLMAWAPDAQNRHPEARLGLMIQDLGDGLLEVACVEHGDTQQIVFEWPMRFVVSYGDARASDTLMAQPDMSNGSVIKAPKRNALEQTATLWGYTAKVAGLSCLNHTGAALIPAHFCSLIGGSAQAANASITELSGLTRFTVACLSLLNSIAEIEPMAKPTGRYIVSGGSSKSYMARSVVRLRVPKRIRDVVKYTRSEIRSAGRRLHQVRGHYRYLRYEPMTPGWERVELAEGVFFRRWIDPCLRGDESLGVVERLATIVSGKTREVTHAPA